MAQKTGRVTSCSDTVILITQRINRVVRNLLENNLNY